MYYYYKNKSKTIRVFSYRSRKWSSGLKKSTTSNQYLTRRPTGDLNTGLRVLRKVSRVESSLKNNLSIRYKMNEWEKLLKTPLREKKPILKKWTDPANHAAYNKKCVSGTQYGILTGRPNNLFAIDLDVYKTNDGMKYDAEYFKKICGEDVYIIRTASGGSIYSLNTKTNLISFAIGMILKDLLILKQRRDRW